MTNEHIRLGPCPLCRNETHRSEKLEHSTGVEFDCPNRHQFELQIADGFTEMVLVLSSDLTQRWLVHLEGFVLQPA